MKAVFHTITNQTVHKGKIIVKRKPILTIILGFLLLFLSGCGSRVAPDIDIPVADPQVPATSSHAPPAPGKQGKVEVCQLKVHFIDVEQGDAILAQLPNGQTMLVDAGKNEDGSTVVAYLQQLGIKQVDYLVGTHPHSDHIGGLPAVIKAFDIGKVYMPRVTHNTETFQQVLLAIKQKGLKITPARAGTAVLDQDNLNIVFVAPGGTDYENLNDWSAVMRISYSGTAFLLTGDAQAKSEQEMLQSGADLQADVLKVGHHGSNSSTSQAFLKTVNPKYAVISAGAGNDYGHPHAETLTRLKGIEVYRTDLMGTVIFTSEGENLTVSKIAATVKPRAPNAAQSHAQQASEDLYIGNKNSKKLHRSSCSGLPDEHNRVYFPTKKEAERAGYQACKICNP